MLSLRAAAECAGTSKTSLFRAIKAGRLSATRTETGELRIDPAELARAYPPKPPKHSASAPPEHDGMAALQVRNADLAARVELLSRMLDDMRAERDRWASQA